MSIFYSFGALKINLKTDEKNIWISFIGMWFYDECTD
jgi:hypothetical protein